jgi:hypothetical protein
MLYDFNTAFASHSVSMSTHLENGIDGWAETLRVFSYHSRRVSTQVGYLHHRRQRRAFTNLPATTCEINGAVDPRILDHMARRELNLTSVVAVWTLRNPALPT